MVLVEVNLFLLFEEKMCYKKIIGIFLKKKIEKCVIFIYIF